MRSKQSSKAWKSFGMVGLFGLLPILLILFLLNRNRKPKQLIESEIIKAGFSPFMAKFWVCVSAVETNGWTSLIYKNYHNLFSIVWNKSLVYGLNSWAQSPGQSGMPPTPEGQAFFNSDSEAAKDIVLYMKVRFKYPNTFNTLADGVHYIKSKGFFASNEANYLVNVTYWFKKLY